MSLIIPNTFATKTGDIQLSLLDENFTYVGDNAVAIGTGGDISLTGNLALTGIGKRITGDFSNANFDNRVAFQTSTVNGHTRIFVLPNGTSTTTSIKLANTPNAANSSVAELAMVGGTDARLLSAANGTGTYLPMTMYTGGSERIRIDTAGNVGIGTNSPDALLVLNKATGASDLRFKVASVLYGTIYTSSSDFTMNTTAAIPLTLGTNNTERIRIDSAGNVGIGTSSPSSKYHARTDGDSFNVIGQIQNRNAGANTGGAIAFINAANDLADNRYAYIGAITSGAAQNGNNLVFATNLNGSGPVERMRITSTGQLRTMVTGGPNVSDAFACRAWVNFNGVGAVFIRAAGNVSSITDNNVGDYTVNFITAMQDTNYAPMISGGRSFNAYIGISGTVNNIAATTTAFRFQSFDGGSIENDFIENDVAIFR